MEPARVSLRLQSADHSRRQHTFYGVATASPVAVAWTEDTQQLSLSSRMTAAAAVASVSHTVMSVKESDTHKGADHPTD